MNEEVYKEFLSNFPKEKRSLVMNQFCTAYREGNHGAGSLIEVVRADARKRVAKARSQVDLQVQSDLLRLLDSSSASSMAEYVIWWERLDWKIKDKIKAERSEGFRESYMKSQPPTEKQLKYLKGLGCPVVPETKLEASRLIEEWK